MTVMLTSMGTAIRPLRVTTIAVSTRHHSPSATRRGDHDHRAMACGEVGPVRPCQATAAIRTAPNSATVTTGDVAALAFLPHPWRRTLAKQVLAAARGHVAGLLDRYRSVRAASAGARVTVPVVTVALFGAVLMAAVAWHGLTGPTSPQAIARWSWSPRLVADGEWWRVLTAIVVTRNGLMAVPMLVS